MLLTRCWRTLDWWAMSQTLALPTLLEQLLSYCCLTSYPSAGCTLSILASVVLKAWPLTGNQSVETKHTYKKFQCLLLTQR
jgi:hypothetical protein